MAALRGIEREKEIAFEALVDAIETALLTAYRHTEGAAADARVHVDRQSGDVAVLVRESDENGTVLREYDDTPDDFGRVAATTARQVIVQRLREVQSEVTYDEYSGREREVVSGVVQHQ
jgi:N utilization substance protein A